MTRTPQAPSYDRYHGDYARVVIDRRSIHLGKYDSEDSHNKYRELIATWSAGQTIEKPVADTSVSVAEVFEGYREYAESYYGDVPRGRYRNLLPTLKTVRLIYADLPAREFSPKKLKVVRQAFVDAGYTRGHVNTCVQRVIAVFRWAAEEELVSGSVVHGMEAVRPLQRGHTNAPEGKTVHAVPQATVDATLPHLVPVQADMVRLELLSGCRPGELCSLTPSQVDRSGDVWVYKPRHHKTEHHGHERVICFGPKAQDVLRKYLLRPTDAPCFSPKEALAQHLDRRHEERETPMNEGNKPVQSRRKRAIVKVHDRYDVAAYRRAIERACDRAFPAPDDLKGSELRTWRRQHRWTPHRLRHTCGTVVREQFGLDGSQAVLGHRNARVSEIYSELNVAKAARIAREIG